MPPLILRSRIAKLELRAQRTKPAATLRGRAEPVALQLGDEQAPHQPIDTIWRDRSVERAPRGVVLQRPEQRAVVIGAMTGGIEVIIDQAIRAGMQREIAGLAAFARHFQMRHAFACVPEVLHLQLAQLLAPQGMEQQRREDGPIAFAAKTVIDRCIEQLASLVIAKGRRLAFAALHLRPLHAFDRVVGDGVLLAEIFEQRGERREPVPDGAAAEAALRQLVTPSDDMDAGDGAEFFGRTMPAKRMKSPTAFS